MSNREPVWTVGDLPFTFKPLTSPHNPNGLPDRLPFRIRVNRRSGTFVQDADPAVSSFLARAYSLGSTITGQMDDEGIGRGYADDFLNFIMGQRELSTFRGKRVLEVGCGNGFLLHQLATHGADVIGIDPGDHAKSKYDVPIIRDFFPSRRIAGKFDTIIGFAMLEHVEDPERFLQELFTLLAPGGDILLGVPDCGPYLAAGDISCLFHEHWSYFDGESLARTVRGAGGITVDVSAGRFGGMLFARVTQDSEQDRGTEVQDQLDTAEQLVAFRKRAEHAIDVVTRYFFAARVAGEAVGVYVPGRIVNALCAGNVAIENCRFFDDSPLLKASYYPGIPVPVENRGDLIAHPPDRVLIMSRSFGNLIANELREQLPARVQITGWDELFASAA